MDYEQITIDAVYVSQSIELIKIDYASSTMLPQSASVWDDYYCLMDDLRPICRSLTDMERSHKLDLSVARTCVQYILTEIADAMSEGREPCVDVIVSMADDAIEAVGDATLYEREQYCLQQALEDRYTRAGVPVTHPA